MFLMCVHFTISTMYFMLYFAQLQSYWIRLDLIVWCILFERVCGICSDSKMYLQLNCFLTLPASHFALFLSLSLCLIITFIDFFFFSTFLFYFLFFHAIRFADSLHFIHMLTVLPCIRARFMANSISSCVGFNSVPHSWSDGMLKPSRECICFRLQPFDWHAFRIYTLSINSVLYISKDCSLSTCFFRFCCECEGFFV